MNIKQLILLIMLATTFNCQYSHKAYKDFLLKEEQDMQKLDSLLASYESQPSYYVEYSNDGCLYDIRINDEYVDKIWTDLSTGGTVCPINTEILYSGKQKVSVKLLPVPGETMIRGIEPFTLRIGHKDFAEQPEDGEARTWHWVLEMPKIEIPEEGIPSFEYEAEFEAQVPYRITGWLDCIDLRQIPDIEARVVTEFKRIRQLLLDEKYEEYKMLRHCKFMEIAKAFYFSSEEYQKDWEDDLREFKAASKEEWQEIEDYELVFYANGRLVTLESKKYDGYESALLRMVIEDSPYDQEYDDIHAKFYYLHLGIRRGTNEFILLR
jgi:hypothetical protein